MKTTEEIEETQKMIEEFKSKKRRNKNEKVKLILASIMTVTMALVPTVQASDITVKVNGEEFIPKWHL